MRVADRWKGSSNGDEDGDNLYFPTLQELIAGRCVSGGTHLKPLTSQLWMTMIVLLIPIQGTVKASAPTPRCRFVI
jgi:hypothetical protein